MSTFAQQSSLATVPLMAVMNRISPISMKGYLPLLDTFTKHKVLIISVYSNALVGKYKNKKFCIHSFPNINGQYRADF